MMKNSLLLLGELSNEDMQWLTQHGKQFTLTADTVLIQEGQRIDALYILLTGTLQVMINASEETSHPRAIARLTAGEIIGEMSLIDHRPPSATVLAETDATVFSISQTLLAQRSEENVEFGRSFYRSLAYCLSNRLRLMNVSLPQAGIEVSGALPAEIDNPEIRAHLALAQSRLDDLMASAEE